MLVGHTYNIGGPTILYCMYVTTLTLASPSSALQSPDHSSLRLFSPASQIALTTLTVTEASEPSLAKEFSKRTCVHLALKCAAIGRGCQAAEGLLNVCLCYTDYALHGGGVIVCPHVTKLLPGSLCAGRRLSPSAEFLKVCCQLGARPFLGSSAVITGLRICFSRL